MATSFHQRYLADGMRGNEFLPLGVDHAAQRANDKRDPVVVTGQQVGLFLGPLYTLAKAASAIAYAKQLNATPLFWLQTEDHDFAEIDHAWLPGLQVRIAGDGRRIPVAQRMLGEDITAVLGHVTDAVAGRPHAAETLALLARHYRPGASLANAFSGLLSELFPELRFFDPRAPDNVEKMAPVIQKAFARAAAIDDALTERCAALTEAGYKLQVPHRRGTPLPFVHDEAGERQRMQAPAAVLDPMRYSTSALLRPIVQDTLLPTALYVGGPAEVDYFAQAACLYPVFDLPPPIVALRGRVRLLPPRIGSTLSKLGLEPSDLDDEHTTTLKLAERLGVLADVPNATWLREIDKRLDGLKSQYTERARRSIHYAMRALERRVLREVSTREQIVSERLARARAWLRPGGQPQERVLSFVAFAAEVGPLHLAERLRAEIAPPALKDIRL